MGGLSTKKTGAAWLPALMASIAALYAFLAPINLPLYNTVMFPLPDPRIVNLDRQFEELRLLNVKKKDVSLRSADGRIIRGWFLELPNTKRVFLYSHGKGGNIYGKLNTARILLNCGGSVLMYDYQGFGASEGRASIGRSVDDALAAYDYLIEKEKRSPHDIIAFGGSFGCGVTGQLVTRRQVGGVILQCGFTSLMRAARDTLFWLRFYPDWLFPREIVMDNVAIFSKEHPPLLIVHGTKDRTVSFANATDLYRQAIEPKAMLVIPNGGHGAYGTMDQFVGTVKSFLAKNGL